MNEYENEYDIPAWSPKLVADINHLERIQSLATRSVTAIRSYPTKRGCGVRSLSNSMAELSPHPQLHTTD